MLGFSSIAVVKNELMACQVACLLENTQPSPQCVGIFEIEDGNGKWEVGSFYKTEPQKIQFLLIEKIFNINFVFSRLKNENWVEKVQRDLKPVILKHFVVCSSHYIKKIKTNKIKVEIQASMAFGTGHHGTTVGCLKAIEYLYKKKLYFKNFLDLGTGTGLLAIAISKKFKILGLATDCDDISYRVAKTNVKKNGMSNKIIVVKAFGFNKRIIRNTSKYDLITANILLKPLCSLANEFNIKLNDNGFLILSGITKDQVSKIYSVFKSNNLFIHKKFLIGNWVTIILKK